MKTGLLDTLHDKLRGSRLFRFFAASMIQKYLSVILIFNMILLIAFSVILHRVILFYTREDAYATIARQGQQINGQVDDYVRNMQYILTTLYISKDIKRVIIDSSDAPFEEYMSYKYTFNFIDTLVYAKKHIDITLLTLNRQRVYSTDERLASSFLSDYAIDGMAWFDKIRAAPSSYVFLTDYRLPEAMDENQVACIARFSFVDALDGILIVSSQNEFMEEIIRSNLIDGVSGIVILDGQGGVLTSHHDAERLDRADMLSWCADQQVGGSDTIYRAAGQSYRVTVHQSELTRFRVLSFISEQYIDQRSALYKWGLTGLFVLVFVVIALLNFIFMRNVIGEIRTILAYAHANQVRPPARRAGRTDEIGELSKTVNTMVVRNMEAALLVKDAQIRMLQQQINPHFLYNVLEAISSMALVSGQERIADVIFSLSKVFRHNLSDTGRGYICVTVGEELDHLDNIFALYQLRYGEGLVLVKHIDPSVLPCRIIRFVFQPIVENALKHGLIKGRHDLTITITGSRTGDRLVFCIADDGAGMTPEKLAGLQAALTAEDSLPVAGTDARSGGIGLQNVQQRIRLSCGDACGLVIQSRPGEGTAVTITLPAEE